ncbi:MAG: hypothetical protein AAGK97_13795 [Bacteroidota bacterium]
MLLSTLSLDFSAKTWIYMADRAFTWDETDSLRPEIYQFGEQWSSHNQNLLSYGELFHHRFIVLMVDETNAGASGCSIDSSVHFVQAMGQKYNVDFFNRTLFAYMEDEQVHTLPKHELAEAYANGKINDETLMFNNLVKTRQEFEDGWIAPLSETWIKRFV